MVDLCDRLEALLHELFCVVQGECPGLLDEDSGGNSVLALKIEAALEEARGRK